MRNIRHHFLLAFAIVFVAIAAFALNALAEPEIFDSPQILADTDENFVLRDNINGTETAYSRLQDPLEALYNKSGNYTLYFMRDYTVNDYSALVYQKGTYTLLVRSAGNNTYTYKSTKVKHFQLEDLSVPTNQETLRNKYENIILDGGQENFVPTDNEPTHGGVSLYNYSEITIGKGCVIQRCFDPGYRESSPIYALGKHTKVIVEDGARFINNITKEYPRFGVITVYDGTLEINGGEFIDNYTGKLGGLITCDEAQSVTIKNSTFKNNESDGYGTIFVRKSDTKIDNCTFTNNHGSSGGAINADYSKINISNSKFFTNGCETGGAIALDGSSATIKNCLFKNNYAHYYYGGAIDADQSSTLDISDSEFLENGPHKRKVSDNYTIDFCPRKGGAIVIRWKSRADIKNCLFKGNIAADSGGAIYTFRFTNKNAHDDYAETQGADAYDNLKIDDKTQFIDNYVRNGYSVPPLNFDKLTNLKFKSNSFTGKDYPPMLNLDKSLLNNYDVNYVLGTYSYVFDANGGSISTDNGPVKTLVEQLKPQVEYTIGKNPPVKDGSKFMAWEDEDGELHKPGETLPPASRNRIFKAKWQESMPDNKIISAPQTGDTSNIVLYVVLAAVAIGIFGFIISKNKRKK